jgi:hypothetical protein
MSKRRTEEEKREIINAYELAYRMTNTGKFVSIVQPKPGWYRLIGTGGKRPMGSYRLTRLSEMTNRLLGDMSPSTVDIFNRNLEKLTSLRV